MRENESKNEHCNMAAQMLGSLPALLDYRLVAYLNRIACLTHIAGGKLISRQVIAAAIVSWQEGKVDDFTKSKKGAK